MSGFIKLYRQILDWDWYKDSVTKDLFLHLILKANYKSSNWRGEKVGKGELVTGRKQLSEELNFSERQIRTAITRLKSTGEVTIKTTKKFSVIKIVNYAQYNSENDLVKNDDRPSKRPSERPTSDQQATNKRPTNDHIQEEEEVKKLRISNNMQKTVVEILDKKAKRHLARVLKFKCALAREQMTNKKPPEEMYNPTGFVIGEEKKIAEIPGYLPEIELEIKLWRLKKLRPRLEKRRKLREVKARLRQEEIERENAKKLELEYNQVMAKIQELPLALQQEIEEKARQRFSENFKGSGAIERVESGSAWGRKLLIPYFVEVFCENYQNQEVTR